MINAILAAFFVTASLLALAYEAIFKKRRPGTTFLITFYAIGTLIWGYVGMRIESVVLMGISSIQFTCCLIVYSQIQQKAFKL